MGVCGSKHTAMDSPPPHRAPAARPVCPRPDPPSPTPDDCAARGRAVGRAITLPKRLAPNTETHGAERRLARRSEGGTPLRRLAMLGLGDLQNLLFNVIPSHPKPAGTREMLGGL